MPTETKQKRKFCKVCKAKTLHVAHTKTVDVGCGFIAINLFLSIITLGIWLPFFIFIFGIGTFANALSPLNRKYLCQTCGRRN